jgi:hypothetical protein
MVRSRLAGGVTAAILVALASSACLLKADGFTGGSPTSSGDEAGAPDGGTGPGPGGGDSGGGGGGSPEAGPDASSGPRPNLLVNGDFELGCAGWDVGFGFLSEASVAHGGTRSCKFCMDTNFEALMTRSATVAAHKGDTYLAEVWFQAAQPTTTMKSEGYSGSSVAVSAAGQDANPTDGPPIDGTWQRASTLATLTADATELDFVFHLQQQGNPASVGDVICVYVDDAAVRLTP